MNLSIPRRSRALALTAVLLITALLSALLVTFSSSAAPAEAHTPRHTVSCTSLAVSATAYGANANNRVTVVIDGVTVVDRTFGASYQGTFPWSQTEDHTWSVRIDQGDGNTYDYFREGVQTACQPQTPTSVGAEPTFQDVCGPDYSLSVPADTAGYRFTRDESGVQGGAGTITVTATLNPGYVWQDRSTTPRTWTFQATNEPCDVVVDVPAQPALQDVCGPDYGQPELPTNEAYTWTVDDSGVVDGAGTVVITATLNPGYVWAGGGKDAKSFTYEVTNEPCDVVVEVPAQPTMQDVCGPEYGSPELPSNEAYTWSVDDSGVVDGAGTVVITATLNPGYVWAGGSKDVQSFSYDVTNEPCDVPTTVEGSPSVLDQCGVAYDVQVPATTDADGYAFTVDETGVVDGAGTVVITATIADGYTWQDGTTEARTWEFPVTSEPCATDEIPAPSANEVCGPDGDAPYTIPADGEHYSYVVTDPGTYTDGERVITVVVEFDEGYTAPEGATTEWTFSVYDEPCDTPVTGVARADVDVTPATCFAPGTAGEQLIENADWTTVDMPAAGGQATFVATAHVGSSFEAGLPGVSTDGTTRTFVVDVPAAGGELCSIAPPPVQPPAQDTPSTPPTQATPPTLPRTGFDISSILVLGTLLALAGATLVARRIRVEG